MISGSVTTRALLAEFIEIHFSRIPHGLLANNLEPSVSLLGYYTEGEVDVDSSASYIEVILFSIPVIVGKG